MRVASEAYCGVELVNTVAVQLDEAPWDFATQNGEKISTFWRPRSRVGRRAKTAVQGGGDRLTQ